MHERGARHMLDPSRLIASADADLRRRHGPPVGRASCRCPRNAARASRRRDDRAVARGVHARARLAPRRLPPRADRDRLRRRRRRRADRRRPGPPADAAARHRPRGVARLAGARRGVGARAPGASRTSARTTTSTRTSRRCTRASTAGRTLARGTDAEATPTAMRTDRARARPTATQAFCRRCRPTRCGPGWIATGARTSGQILAAVSQTVELPRTQDPGTGLGGAWRVIVRNDDHNTFDHVAHTLARYVPGVTVDGGYAIADQIHNTRTGDRVERPPGARGAVLGAAQRRRPDYGPARAGIAPPGSQPGCRSTAAPCRRRARDRLGRGRRAVRGRDPRHHASARSRSTATTSRSSTSPGCPRRARRPTRSRSTASGCGRRRTGSARRAACRTLPDDRALRIASAPAAAPSRTSRRGR